MRAGCTAAAWAYVALAAVFAPSALAQEVKDSVSRPTTATETIAVGDALAATAGIPANGPEAAAPAAAVAQQVPPAAQVPPSGFDRFASWMGVDSSSSGWLHLGTWDGSFGFTYSGDRLDSSGSNSTTSIATEYLNIANRGWSIFDPRFISGNIGVTLGLDQVKQEFGSQEQRQHGTVDGYTFDATFLGEKPLYAKAWADRIQGYTTQSFGGTTKDTVSTAGASLNLRPDNWLRQADILPDFEATLQAYRQHTLQQSSYSGSTYDDDQVQNVVNLNAHSGTETSDLYVLLQYVDFNYLSYGIGSYRSRGGAVNYSGDFGANLNTTWTSSLGYNDREGDIPLKTVTVNETVDVHHNSDLQTSYAYNLYRQEGNGGNALNQNATASVFYTLWQHLAVTAAVSGADSRFDNGKVEGITGSVGLDYHRNLDIGGQVFLNAQGNYAHITDKSSSGDVPVTDEFHSAPPVLGVGNGFALANGFVTADSIVVVDTRGGARIPTTAALDYTITTDGNLTRILVLPTSRVIQPSDPLAISYVYLIPEQASYHSSNESLTVGMDLGWLGVSYTRTQTNAPQLASGGVTLTGNSTTDTLIAALRANWRVVQAGLGANLQRYDSTSLAYKTQTYSAGISYQPFYAIGLNFNGGWSRTEYTVPERTSGTANGRIDVNFYAPPSIRYDVLWATLFALRNRITDSEFPTQTLTQFGTTFNYMLGKLTLTASAQHGDFARANSTTKSTQFNLSVNRRF